MHEENDIPLVINLIHSLVRGVILSPVSPPEYINPSGNKKKTREKRVIYGNCLCCIFPRCIITGRYRLEVTGMLQGSDKRAKINGQI